MKLPYTKQEDYLIPNIMIDMCFVLLNRYCSEVNL